MPKTTTANGEIETLVAEFTTNLSQVMRRTALQEVLAVLEGGAAAAPKQGRRGRPAGSRNKRGSIDHEKMGERLLAHVSKNPGQRGEQIAAAVGSNVDTIRPAMKKLIAAKKIKTKGQRRGMYYFPTGRG
jgi:hypothetical protein